MANLHPGHSTQQNLTEILSIIWRDVKGRSASSFRSHWNPPVLIKSFFFSWNHLWFQQVNISQEFSCWRLIVFKTFSLLFSGKRDFDHLSCTMVPLPGVFQFSGHLWEELCRIHLNLYLRAQRGGFIPPLIFWRLPALWEKQGQPVFTCSHPWLGYFQV